MRSSNLVVADHGEQIAQTQSLLKCPTVTNQSKAFWLPHHRVGFHLGASNTNRLFENDYKPTTRVARKGRGKALQWCAAWAAILQQLSEGCVRSARCKDANWLIEEQWSWRTCRVLDLVRPVMGIISIGYLTLRYIYSCETPKSNGLCNWWSFANRQLLPHWDLLYLVWREARWWKDSPTYLGTVLCNCESICI